MKRRASRAEIDAARNLQRAFREAEPRGFKRMTLPKVPRAVMNMGRLDFIGYTTTHNGKETLYTHVFERDSRPHIGAGPKRNQLYILGGRYRVSGRGVVDLDPHGRQIEDEAVSKARLRQMIDNLA